MTEEKTIAVSEVETAVSDYESADAAVLEAQENLEKIKAEREEKKAAAQKSLDELKARFESVSSVVTETVQEVATEVEAKLDAAKDEWAQLAMTDPDAARRQLRKFCILVAGCSGLVIGSLVSSLVAWIF